MGADVRLAGIAIMSYELNGSRSPALTLIGDEGDLGEVGVFRSKVRIVGRLSGNELSLPARRSVWRLMATAYMRWTFYDQKLRIECWAIEQDEVLEGTFTQDDGRYRSAFVVTVMTRIGCSVVQETMALVVVPRFRGGISDEGSRRQAGCVDARDRLWRVGR